MRIGAKGKYTRQMRSKPRGLGVCDYSGLMVQHAKMVKQYEYAGMGLYWTGFYVNPKYQDVPNPQNLIPIIKLDPVPLDHARPDPVVYNAQTTSVTVDLEGMSGSILLTEEQLNNDIISFTGSLLGSIIVYIPNILTEFYANNRTTGGFSLGMQIEGNVSEPLDIPKLEQNETSGPLVANNFLNLSIVYH